MFYLLFILIGGALGYIAAPKARVSPLTGAGVGAAGGLLGGALVKFIFPILLGLFGAALGALALLYVWREVRRR